MIFIYGKTEKISIMKLEEFYCKDLFKTKEKYRKKNITNFINISKILFGLENFFNIVTIDIPLYFYRKNFEKFSSTYEEILKKNKIDNYFLTNKFFNHIIRYEKALSRNIKKLRKMLKYINRISKKDIKIKELQNLLKNHIKIYFLTDKSIDIYCNEIKNLNIHQLYFLCFFIERLILKNHMEISRCILSLYNDLKNLKYVSQLEVSKLEVSKLENKKNIIEIILEMAQKTIILYSKIYPSNFEEIYSSQTNFSIYLLSSFLKYSKENNKHHNINQINKLIDQNKEILKFKNTINIIMSQNFSLILDLLKILFYSIWNLIKIDGINIFFLTEIIIFKMIEFNNPHMDIILGKSIFTLNKIFEQLNKNNFFPDFL